MNFMCLAIGNGFSCYNKFYSLRFLFPRQIEQGSPVPNRKCRHCALSDISFRLFQGSINQKCANNMIYNNYYSFGSLISYKHFR